MNSVAKNLKNIRISEGYTQDDLAKALNVTRQTISTWETGRSEPDIDTLASLADYLQIDVTELIYGKKSQPYKIMQKKYIVCCIVFGVIVIIGLIAHLWGQRWLLEYRRQTNDILPGLLYETLLIPICTAAAGALIMSILSFWKATAVKRPWRYLLLIIGIAALAPILGSAIQFAIWNPEPTLNHFISELDLWFPFVFRDMITLSVWEYGTPFIAGICLFLGVNRGK